MGKGQCSDLTKKVSVCVAEASQAYLGNTKDFADTRALLLGSLDYLCKALPVLTCTGGIRPQRNTFQL